MTPRCKAGAIIISLIQTIEYREDRFLKWYESEVDEALMQIRDLLREAEKSGHIVITDEEGLDKLFKD